MAHNYGLLKTNSGQLWGIVACNFQLLGCPGRPVDGSFHTSGGGPILVFYCKGSYLFGSTVPGP